MTTRNQADRLNVYTKRKRRVEFLAACELRIAKTTETDGLQYGRTAWDLKIYKPVSYFLTRTSVNQAHLLGPCAKLSSCPEPHWRVLHFLIVSDVEKAVRTQ